MKIFKTSVINLLEQQGGENEKKLIFYGNVSDMRISSEKKRLNNNTKFYIAVASKSIWY